MRSVPKGRGRWSRVERPAILRLFGALAFRRCLLEYWQCTAAQSPYYRVPAAFHRSLQLFSLAQVSCIGSRYKYFGFAHCGQSV
ncbi:hypothetical protein HYPSUDRAFT_91876 [Hypholoma sublateritium FD-334 SS-4]|uniref:Uncharacterized protein n=1 Tax=Hypholoma sublateritium (strain FD-334 SS-4) TaxID=945553 RepID=A0A0D2N8R0_HYPSF|nr:hypothetical protein HYPSUDRAFT_91876 [Hypholoma sublateritium FD-334 SS-4]